MSLRNKRISRYKSRVKLLEEDITKLRQQCTNHMSFYIRTGGLAYGFYDTVEDAIVDAEYFVAKYPNNTTIVTDTNGVGYYAYSGKIGTLRNLRRIST